MINILKWLFGIAEPVTPPPELEPEDDEMADAEFIIPNRGNVFAVDDMEEDEGQKRTVKTYVDAHSKLIPVADRMAQTDGGYAIAMDTLDGQGEASELKRRVGINQPNLSDSLAMWYATQGFIGHQLAAMIAQHWLIDKVCTMPAEDAIRNGFTITGEGGDAIPPEVVEMLCKADRKYNLTASLLDYVRKGRIFGIRIAIFKMKFQDKATEKAYYQAPFNLEGVQPGMYAGIVQVDPYWCAPELDAEAASQPDSMHFYEPTWWNISGTRYHRSHLMVYINCPVSDIIKPSYIYGGIPVPQQIMERVYGAERTANEAPLLALTKRTTIYKTDIAKAVSNWPKFVANVAKWSKFWNNNGIRVIDTDEEIVQNDTALADMDVITMTQYQLVAAAGCVPATKLLGTQPKGFSATGEFDEASYHEFLESLQEHKLTAFVERHHAIAMRSDIASRLPALNINSMVTSISWEPLDSPTAVEYAAINLSKAQTGQALVTSGAIDGIDERNRVRKDKDSGYVDIPEAERPNDTGATAPPQPASAIGPASPPQPATPTNVAPPATV